MHVSAHTSVFGSVVLKKKKKPKPNAQKRWHSGMTIRGLISLLESSSWNHENHLLKFDIKISSNS